MPITSEIRIMLCVDLVEVSDVVPVVCRATEDAGIRSVRVTNFKRVPSFVVFQVLHDCTKNNIIPLLGCISTREPLCSYLL